MGEMIKKIADNIKKKEMWSHTVSGANRLLMMSQFLQWQQKSAEGGKRWCWWRAALFMLEEQ